MATSRTRMGRKRLRKKKSKLKSRVLSVLLILFISAIGYSIYEYKAGFHHASNEVGAKNGNSDSGASDDFKGQESKLGKVNVLLLGVDSSKTNKSRTDTVMIAQYDPKNGTAKIASIMRDSYVSIPGHSNNKINTAFYYGGAELIRQTIKENFDIDVQYYALVNFNGFTNVVDVIAPDGIEIDVEKDMYYVDNAGGLTIDLDQGVQKLDGKELLGYARFRHDSESDFGRVRRQQQVINAVKDEFVSIKGVVKLPRILGTIDPFVETNLSNSEMLSIGKDFLLNPVNDIETIRIPVDDSYSFKRYSHAGSVISMDIEENKQALKEFFSSDSSQKTTATADSSQN